MSNREDNLSGLKQQARSLSVIIPLYNGQDVIRNSLDSVAKSFDYLYQRQGEFGDISVEIIVVDDFSSDDGMNVVATFSRQSEYPVLLIHQPKNRGQSAARNTGVHYSKADLVLFCDQDDLFLREHAYICLGMFQGNTRQELPLQIQRGGRPMLIPVPSEVPDVISTGVALDDDIHPYWKKKIEGSLPLNLCVKRECHVFVEGFPEDEIYRLTGGGEDCVYRESLYRFFRVLGIGLETVKYIRRPGNSFDAQLVKFMLPPGEYVEDINNRESGRDWALLSAERTQAARKRLEHLSRKMESESNQKD